MAESFIIHSRLSKARGIAHCDHYGNGVVLPFTCQHCGGKFCTDCRLLPDHECTGIGSWHAKPRPVIGMNYSKGSGVTATGGVAPEEKTGDGLPYLKSMIIVIILLVLTGTKTG